MMLLELDRDDLKPEHKDIACSLTEFKHFKPVVQLVLINIGDAMFYCNGRTNHNKIIAPDLLNLRID